MFGFNKQKKLNRRLAAAALDGNIRDIAALLDAGAGIETRDHGNWGMTPLNVAAYKGHHPAVKLLLDRGAQIDSQDNAGDTPLMNCVHADRREALQELLSRGANRHIQNIKGLTAADLAKRRSDAVIRKALGLDQEKPAPPPPAPPEMNPDEVVLSRRVGNKLLEEIFNFSARERISLIRTGASGPVEAMTRESFDVIGERVLRRAFDSYVAQGGAIPETEVFPETIAKIKPQPRNS
ncbi:MAG: ankyrin repeat domain-containing protein [Alphaproteobacteria bacterium]